MKVKIICNNYIYGKIKNQLRFYILEDNKIDSKHHEIIFNVNNQREVDLIEKISTYKSIII
ncbi:MAG: hypothetical protein PHS24_04820 [Bacilli bacterium]|nr:hypothetical protein [Bacilli bacterium]